MIGSLLKRLIWFYQAGISPYIGRRCRFYPSCSEFAAEAIEIHGAAKGTALAAQRLLKCHPFHPGGYDPVPSLANAGDCGCCADTKLEHAPGIKGAAP